MPSEEKKHVITYTGIGQSEVRFEFKYITESIDDPHPRINFYTRINASLQGVIFNDRIAVWSVGSQTHAQLVKAEGRKFEDVTGYIEVEKCPRPPRSIVIGGDEKKDLRDFWNYLRLTRTSMDPRLRVFLGHTYHKPNTPETGIVTLYSGKISGFSIDSLKEA